MNRASQILIVSLLALVWGVATSFAQSSLIAPKRIALVVGNSNYIKIQSLPNPANDSKLMAQTLRNLGFEVISAVDTNRITLSRAVRDFGRALRKSGKDTVGLFYYAGHGVQARGENYLIPLGAEVEDAADLEIEAITASVVLSQMEAAGNKLNMVILDACRNNPYKAKLRSNSRGLARVNAASGSLVAFAAAPGQVAADGAGDNSPYTKALVKAMQVPGLSVEQMFKKVRISVESQTNNRQTPWEESSLRGDFFFTPEKAEPEHVAAPAVDEAAREWAIIQNTQSSTVLRAFIKRYPESVYADYARFTLEDKMTAANSRKQAREEAAKAAASKKASAEKLAKKQQQMDRKAREVSLWNLIQSSSDPTVFEEYIARYPKGDFAILARSRIKILKKSKEQKLASLQPGSTNTYQPTPAMDPYQLTILLQSELTRVGCSPGKIDGQWGAKGRRALALFKRYAGVSIPYKDISPQTIDAVKQQRSRACPKSTPVKIRKARASVKSATPKNKKIGGKAYYLFLTTGEKYKTWSECIVNNYDGKTYCEKRTR